MKRLLIILSLALITAGCSKSGSSNPQPVTPVTPTPPAPAQASLSLPAQNAACTSGTVISNTQSSITFSWNASGNTDSYELDIKDLLDNSITIKTTSQTSLAVTLLRNTPYSWYIVSKSSKSSSIAQSDTWKFYIAGQGTLSYAPFPADIVSPANGQQIATASATVNLSWTGSAVDNDIVGYDVYFGTTNTPPLLSGSVTNMFLNNVSVSAKTTYYWKIVTKDSQGNTSESVLSQFVTP
jgi:hypothetical protein